MIIRNTLAKTAASMVGAWIGNAIINNTNHYKPKGDKYRIDDWILQTHNVTAVLAGTICPVLLSTLFEKSMLNMPHLGGLACAGMMISAVTTNHYYQKEQITVREEEHDKAQTTLTRTQEQLTETKEERTQAQTERNQAVQRAWEIQSALDQVQRERIEARQQARHLLTRITELQQQPQDVQIRQALGAVYSASDRFNVDNRNRIITAPDYQNLHELQPNNKGQYSFANNECVITRNPVNELYQPVALKTGNVYNVAEYVDLKLWFRTNLSHPLNRDRLTTGMLNTTDDETQILFRVNRNLIAQAPQTPT